MVKSSSPRAFLPEFSTFRWTSFTGGGHGVDYSSVSQERKRLRERLEKDKKAFKLYRNFELEMTRIKKRP